MGWAGLRITDESRSTRYLGPTGFGQWAMGMAEFDFAGQLLP